MAVSMGDGHFGLTSKTGVLTIRIGAGAHFVPMPGTGLSPAIRIPADGDHTNSPYSEEPIEEPAAENLLRALFLHEENHPPGGWFSERP